MRRTGHVNADAVLWPSAALAQEVGQLVGLTFQFGIRPGCRVRCRAKWRAKDKGNLLRRLLRLPAEKFMERLTQGEIPFRFVPGVQQLVTFRRRK